MCNLKSCSFGNFSKKTTETVKIGHWEKSSIPNEKYVCSVCGGACWYYDYQGNVAKSRYCPNCGAHMTDGCIGHIIEFVKREPDEWIKCSEKIPENGKSVLVAIKEDGYTYICVGEILEGGDWMINGEFWYEKSDPAITHWMLLPKPPEV